MLGLTATGKEFPRKYELYCRWRACQDPSRFPSAASFQQQAGGEAPDAFVTAVQRLRKSRNQLSPPPELALSMSRGRPRSVSRAQARSVSRTRGATVGPGEDEDGTDEVIVSGHSRDKGKQRATEAPKPILKLRIPSRRGPPIVSGKVHIHFGNLCLTFWSRPEADPAPPHASSIPHPRGGHPPGC